MPAVTFTVPVKLLDYGNQPRVGIEIVAAPIPAVKKDSEAAYGTEPEAPLTDESGLATLTLISLPGLWYRISGKGINAVRFAAYIPDPEDPRTGTVFPPETVIQFEDIMDESPTPGYSGVVWAGLSAYDVAVAEGFVGTEAEWLTSLEGLTAYEVAVAEGFVGDEVAWLASLVGPVGDDAYEVAVTEGFVGDRDAWLASLVGPQGDTAYEVAVAEGFVGTEAEWLETLIGPMSSLVEGTATTGAPGTDMDFTITGAPPVQTLNLTIPRGDVGPAGPPNVLTEGTATASAPGSDPDFTITGTSPEQVLNLVLPRGEQGPQGYTRYLVQDGAAYPARPFPTEVPVTFVGSANPDLLGVMVVGDSWINTAADAVVPYVKHYDGAGSPNGVVTAQIGSRYIDVNATCGAVEWIKMSGSGNTGWEVSTGDTGWRNVSSLLINGWELSGTGGRVCLRRIGRTVWIYGALSSVSATGQNALTLPSGFLPLAGDTTLGWWSLSGSNGATAPVLMEAHNTLGVIRSALAAYSGEANARFAGSFPARDAWPTTLPGTAT